MPDLAGSRAILFLRPKVVARPSKSYLVNPERKEASSSKDSVVRGQCSFNPREETDMKKKITIGSVLVALLLVAVIAAPAMAGPGSSDPFKGAWKATDGDGSAMTLVISGGGTTRHVTWFDQYWYCERCDPPGNTPTVALGFGEVSDGTLSATLRWHDAPPGEWSDEFTYELLAHPDGTLRDGTFTWDRAGS
jgi:hypothetical protein